MNFKTPTITLKYSNVPSGEEEEKWKILKRKRSSQTPLFTQNSLSFTGDLATVFEFNARSTKETRRSLLNDKTCAGVSWLYLSRQRENSQRSLQKLTETIAILTYNRPSLPADYRYWIRSPVVSYNFVSSVFLFFFFQFQFSDDFSLKNWNTFQKEETFLFSWNKELMKLKKKKKI